MQRNVSVILMTALVPTIGHKALIEFAYVLGNPVVVIVSSRSHEPVPGYDRVIALKKEFYDYSVLFDQVRFHHHEDDDAPQNPSTDEEWNYWKNVVARFCEDFEKVEYFVASEPYGMKMAQLLDAKFMPFDMDRTSFDVKGTTVRQNYFEYFKMILPEFRERLIRTVTLFGAESCGKTTMAKELTFLYRDARMTIEWARPYLEMQEDKTVTPDHLFTIAHGQFALMHVVEATNDTPLIIRDTDLLSTIGYYRLMGIEIPKKVISLFELTKSDMYLVMNDQIPFTPDVLRYGGDVRESNTEFWIDLLEEFGCEYHVVVETDFDEQTIECEEVIDKMIYKISDNLEKFERD